jgi:hypothetical protein
MAEEQRGSRETRTVDRDAASVELAEWRATCRRQAAAIDALTRIVGRLRSGVTALKAENAELRAGDGGLYERSLGSAAAVIDRAPSVQARVALGVHAPAAARRVVTRVLEDHVAPEVLEHANLAISELVTNSVCHGGVAEDGYATVRLFLGSDLVRLEVEDAGLARSGKGFGLHIIQSLSERWGTERSAGGSTRAWAELSLSTTSTRTEQPIDHATSGSGDDLSRMGARRRTHVETARVLGGPAEVHVVPVERAGTWALFVDSVAGALSEHTTETAAESAAREEALRRGCERIVVHDRYHRTRANTLAAIN